MQNRRGWRLAGLLLAAPVIVTSVVGCSSTSDSAAATPSASGSGVVRMWIAPELAECEGVGTTECMQVAYTEGGPTELFYDSIDGFDYEEGTSYVIDVQVNPVASPAADASSLSYSLVSMVSETPGP